MEIFMAIPEEDKTNTEMVKENRPRTLAFASKGIKTGEDFANTMSALMSDLIEGSISPQVGNAVVNAGGKLLKMVEMQHKYGSPPDVVKEKPSMVLATGENE